MPGCNSHAHADQQCQEEDGLLRRAIAVRFEVVRLNTVLAILGCRHHVQKNIYFGFCPSEIISDVILE